MLRLFFTGFLCDIFHLKSLFPTRLVFLAKQATQELNNLIAFQPNIFAIVDTCNLNIACKYLKSVRFDKDFLIRFMSLVPFISPENIRKPGYRKGPNQGV